MIRISVGEFCLEGVIIEPVEQLFAVSAHDLNLGIMHMGVNESWQDQVARIMIDSRSFWQTGQDILGWTTGSNLAVFHQQDAVFDVVDIRGRIGGAGKPQ